MQYKENNQQQPGVVWCGLIQNGDSYQPKVDQFAITAGSSVFHHSLTIAHVLYSYF